MLLVVAHRVVLDFTTFEAQCNALQCSVTIWVAMASKCEHVFLIWKKIDQRSISKLKDTKVKNFKILNKITKKSAKFKKLEGKSKKINVK